METILHYKRGFFVLSFSYDERLASLARAIPGRSYDGKGSWKCTATRGNYSYIIKGFAPLRQTPEAAEWATTNGSTEPEAFKRDDLDVYRYQPKDYEFKVKPYDCQLVTFNYFKGQDHNWGGLFLEMGLGKSKIATDIYSYKKMKGWCKRCFVITPNSVVDNDVEQFLMHSPIKKLIVEPCHGTRAQKLKIISDPRVDVAVLNYESVASLETEIKLAKFDMIVCDESTRIKNPQAQCSKAIHRIGDTAKQRYALTGTPITQNAIDIYSQYKFVDKAIFGPSFWAFKATYAVMGGYMNKVITGYRDLDGLQKKIFSCGVRFTKADCLDLPPKTYEKKYVELNADERKLYKQITEQITTELKGQVITAAMALTKLTKLAQVASGFLKCDDGSILRLKNPSKILELKDIFEDIMPTKIIIWCSYVDNVAQVSELCTKLKLKWVKVDGSVKPQDRQKAVEAFQTNKTVSVFIAQIQTAGYGVTLTAASYEVFFTNTWSLAARLQAEDRAHRIGLKHNLTIIDLVAKKTVDEAVDWALGKKCEFSKLVIDRFGDILANNMEEEKWNI
jgi:SNF2 family DNA or RNA helicase